MDWDSTPQPHYPADLVERFLKGGYKHHHGSVQDAIDMSLFKHIVHFKAGPWSEGQGGSNYG